MFRTSAPSSLSQLRVLRDVIESRDRTSRSIVRVMVMEDIPKPRKTFMLTTGLYDKPGEEVTPGVPGNSPPFRQIFRETVSLRAGAMAGLS